ncbi:glycosyltransferase family 4 protein [Massilia sp. CFBP9012]|uniref:glycosyltransferase family 4 protein n=1 Tax=Massilia sp. CFBP9012 TaxID=3096531 RepID=UPI002A6AB0D0|nr:glycosyltransferase family 4 protein [Massilia sp. CFBP9012]MDY0976370.1 glycosyltransferase family 4 protein [Massilia sp. CFBP9012]
MRILMVSEDLPGDQVGGLGKHVVTLANRLLQEGHAVEILGRGDRSSADPARQIGFAGRFRPGFAIARPGWKEAQLGMFNPLKRPYFARRIARAIDAHAAGFDVVHYHGHLPMTGLYVRDGINFVQTRHDQGSECLTHLRFVDGAVCGRLAPGACTACSARHAGPNPGPVRTVLTALAVSGYRSQAARAFARHKTVFVSDFLRRRFLRAVPDADLSRSRVIPNLVDYACLRALALAAPMPQAGEVVLAGRLDTGKGFAEFLDAAAGRLPLQARLTVVGDGPQRAALERRHAGPQVRFLGWQDHAATMALAARAHLCVVPSVCEEACSTAVLEALALGRGCLALARGGTPELAQYVQYPGQLALAPAMPQLVARLARLLAAAPPPSPIAPPAGFGADAARLLPTLLELYAEPADLLDRHLHLEQRRHAG